MPPQEFKPLERGFPRSLTGPDVDPNHPLELMHLRGLNRASRKAIVATLPRPLRTDARHHDVFAALVENPRFRRRALIDSVNGTEGLGQFPGVSLELALLADLAPDWETLSFDPVALDAACDGDWALIEAHARDTLHTRLTHALPIFMLWPLLRADLERRTTDPRWSLPKAGQLAFVLSTLACNDWFVRRAVKLAPELAGDLSHLFAIDAPTTEAAGAPETTASEPDDCSLPNLGDEWSAIRSELTALQSTWPETPHRETLDRLAKLGKDASRLLARLPEEKRPDDVFASALAALGDQLELAVADPSLDWLTAAECSQLLARWELARRAATDEGALLRLAADAAAALDRLSSSIVNLKRASARVEDAVRLEQDIRGESVSGISGLEKMQLEGRQHEATKARVNAERDRQAAVLSVLGAASPYGERYDVDVDYAARTRDEPTPPPPSTPQPIPLLGEPPVAPMTAASSDDAPTRTAPSGDGDGDGDEPIRTAPPATELEPEPAAPVFQPSAAPASRLDAEAEPNEPRPAMATDDPEAPAAPVEDAPRLAEPEAFNASSGTRCQPVWSLLRMARPALAWHLAAALERTEATVRPPPAVLLQAVALAASVQTSDGPVALALTKAYSDIDPDWFKDRDTPSTWRTALNLLLLAATLRPMVLAASTGAAEIAAYRNLDGRHRSLLDLVHEITVVTKPLQNLRIGPEVLRSAAGEASLRAQLSAIAKDAEAWLSDRAPNRSNKYRPARAVWQQWIKPNGPIHKLISAVVANDASARSRIAKMVEGLTDRDEFEARVAATDRKEIQRRGPDIIAGALEQLWTDNNEAVEVARRWLVAADMLTDSPGPVRDGVIRLRSTFEKQVPAVQGELQRNWPGDDWHQVDAASAVLRRELDAILALFQGNPVPTSPECSPSEILARDLLLVPDIRRTEAWGVASPDSHLIEQLTSWSGSPLDAARALDARLRNGDIAGARMLLTQLSEPDDSDRRIAIERVREDWVEDLRKAIANCRRDAEVGLAFGYLRDDERAELESELSSLEADEQDMEEFASPMEAIEGFRMRIRGKRKRLLDEARRQFEKTRNSMSLEDARHVEAELQRGDLHTFNELMQRVRDGHPPWPDREQVPDAFREFYPQLQQSLSAALEKMQTDDVTRLIRAGGNIGGLSFALEGDPTLRENAAKLFAKWKEAGARDPTSALIDAILDACGLPGKTTASPQTSPRGTKHWKLQTHPIEDRDTCPVPFFGSLAQGRYRVVSIQTKTTAEDLVQSLGPEAQQTPTIVLLLARSAPALWSRLAWATKDKQRSCLILDETLLLFLLSRTGQRLQTWFNVALPLGHSEPYDASAGAVPPEMFYGRVDELRRVTAPSGCYFIYGGRQLGKTALMRRAEKTFHDLEQNRYAVWIDLVAQGIGERRPAVDVWSAIVDKLRELKIPDLKLPDVIPSKQASVDKVVSVIRDFVKDRPGRRILLLLDEADRFFEADGRATSGAYPETRRIKQLMDDTNRGVKVVFAGLHNVLRTASTSNQPLGHLGEAVLIGPLMGPREIVAAEDLITRPIEAAGYAFADRSLVLRILAQTNYYPSLIQLYCTQLLRHLRDTKLQRARGTLPRFPIDESDIETVFSGRLLREAIRLKFKLTLQLDDRYEVIANALGLDTVEKRFDPAQGIEWRQIRTDCLGWWREGFESTPEREFLALLEELVDLGVLRRNRDQPERFMLRNANVLLQLGTREEIENTLQAERHREVVFESTVFHPALGKGADLKIRNPLTYRQLDDIMRKASSVRLVAASDAAGGEQVVTGLREQPGLGDLRDVGLLPPTETQKAFQHHLDRAAGARKEDGITLLVVPPSVPWDSTWVQLAQRKTASLTSEKRFFSVIFVADPAKVWALSETLPGGPLEPWISVLPWDKRFMRKWLEDLQLPTDSVETLTEVTGCWGGLLESVARGGTGALEFAASLKRLQDELNDPAWRQDTLRRLTGGIAAGIEVLATLQQLQDGSTADDIAVVASLPENGVRRALRWAEPLGLITRLPGDAWALDPFTKRLLAGPPH
jgi:hypothetical protein